MWCFTLIWGNFMYPVKKCLHRRIEDIVRDTARRRAGKKIMQFLQRVVFDRKFRKLTARQKYLISRYLMQWKQKRVL